MTIKIPIFKSCLLAASLAQLTCSLSAITQLQLPPNTPGLQNETIQKNVNGKPTECLHIIIPNTNYSLFFPQDGSQPTTPETGSYSGAQYNLKEHSDNADKITLWYVNQFLDINDTLDDFLSRNTQKTSQNPKPLNCESLIVSQNDEILNALIYSMKIIASDPIGRTLLYRILIELYRTNEKNEYCCESYLNTTPFALQQRNTCRNLKTLTQQGNNYFNSTGSLCFSGENLGTISVLQKQQNPVNYSIQAYQDENSEHIVLFHELLHWFHFLRNPIRLSLYGNSTINTPAPYNITHFFTPTDLWRKIDYPNIEEIVTILGAPKNYNFYHNGDDLSENAYRASLSQDNPHRFAFLQQNISYHMRCGHVSFPTNIQILIPKTVLNDIILAHTTAIECYKQTTNTSPTNWEFLPKQAIKQIN